MDVGALLKVFETWAGPVLVVVFFAFLGRVGYWVFVVSPRKVRRLVAGLSERGYEPVDPGEADLARAVERLSPVFPVSPCRDADVPPWRIVCAARRGFASARRYVVAVRRLQRDEVGESTSHSTLLLLERRELDLPGTFHLTPRRNPSRVQWEERYGAREVTRGLSDELSRCYEVRSADATELSPPEPLSRALVEACPLLERRDLFRFSRGVNLRFGPDGWGLSPSHDVHEPSELEPLLEVFDRVSAAVPARQA
ncbi:MAG: hypothetical protein EDX89_17315 [Acidobacteria bacterium]|nr:MAG: hypothetical protein EDX89_17315 [Acidobacteriota bacterium]MCE7957440.1 hypothetical protein [Acidobacteria bacterium ACB2]